MPQKMSFEDQWKRFRSQQFERLIKLGTETNDATQLCDKFHFLQHRWITERCKRLLKQGFTPESARKRADASFKRMMIRSMKQEGIL